MRWEINRICAKNLARFRFEPSGSAPLPVSLVAGRAGQVAQIKEVRLDFDVCARCNPQQAFR